MLRRDPSHAHFPGGPNSSCLYPLDVLLGKGGTGTALCTGLARSKNSTHGGHQDLMCVQPRNCQAGRLLGGGLSADAVTQEAPKEDSSSVAAPNSGTRGTVGPHIACPVASGLHFQAAELLAFFQTIRWASRIPSVLSCFVYFFNTLKQSP